MTLEQQFIIDELKLLYVGEPHFSWDINPKRQLCVFVRAWNNILVKYYETITYYDTNGKKI